MLKTEERSNNNENRSNNMGGEKITASELRNGPLAERGCTDVCCCLIFTLFVGLSIFIAIYALNKGHPSQVYTPVDSIGNPCGKGVNQGYPYIYFASPNVKYLWRTTCVKTCPNQHSSVLICKPNRIVNSCKGVMWNTTKTINYNKTTVIYPTKPFFGRLCFPDSSNLQAKLSSKLNLSTASKMSSDFQLTWEVMLMSIGISLVLGFVLMLLIRYCAGVITWLFIISFLLLLLTSTVLSASYYFGYSVNYSGRSITKKAQGSNSNQNSHYFLAAFIILSILTLVAFISVICLCSKIKLSIAIMETSSIFVSDNPSSLTIPLLNVLAIIVYLCWWVVTAIYLYSMGQRVVRAHTYPFGSFTHPPIVQYFGFYQLFTLLWILSFLKATLDFIIVSATSLWYFQYGAENKQYNPIDTSIYRLFRFHLGTVAFGSLVLALVWLLQLLLEWIAAQAKQSGADANPIVSCMVKCCKCYLDCFERFIRFLNKNAYVLTAMTGTNFCTSAKDAFSLILRNPIRFSVVNNIGGIFTVFGRLFLCFFTAVIAFAILQNQRYANISSPIPTTVICGIIGLFVGGNFMTVYGIVADAVLLIFTMEEEIEKYHGKAMKVNRCPEPLSEFINNHA